MILRVDCILTFVADYLLEGRCLQFILILYAETFWSHYMQCRDDDELSNTIISTSITTTVNYNFKTWYYKIVGYDYIAANKNSISIDKVVLF